MRLEFSRPFVESLTGKCHFFWGESGPDKSKRMLGGSITMYGALGLEPHH
jgi:hypothetical protein